VQRVRRKSHASSEASFKPLSYGLHRSPPRSGRSHGDEGLRAPSSHGAGCPGVYNRLYTQGGIPEGSERLKEAPGSLINGPERLKEAPGSLTNGPERQKEAPESLP